MKQKLLRILLIPVLALLPALVPLAPVYAACGASSAAQQVAGGINETTDPNAPTDTSCGQNGISSATSLVVNVLSIVVGAIAVIVIILSGFKYITSGGDASKVGNAKNTLIYALVGVAVAALAQLLVHFVLNQSSAASNAANPSCPTNSKILKSDPACH